MYAIGTPWLAGDGAGAEPPELVITTRYWVVVSAGIRPGDGGDDVEVREGPGRAVDDLGVVRAERPDEGGDDVRLLALLELAQGHVADVGVGLDEDPRDEGGGGLGAGDQAEDVVEQDPKPAGVVAQDADQGVDGDRVADLHQLRLGLAAAVLRPEHDGLAEQPDPSGPRGPLGGRGGLGLAAVALLLGDPLALVADQPLCLAGLVGGEPAAAGRHMAELPVRRGERLVPRHGRLIMEFGQVGQLVLLAPEAELVLRLGGHRRLGPEDHVLVQGAGLGDDVDDPGLLEGQGRLAPLGQHDDAVGMVRVGDDLAPDLAPPAQANEVRPSLRRDRTRDRAGHEPAEAKPQDDDSGPPGDASDGHASGPPTHSAEEWVRTIRAGWSHCTRHTSPPTIVPLMPHAFGEPENPSRPARPGRSER